MNISIPGKPLNLHLYGVAGVAANNDFTGTAFGLMNEMWEIVRAGGLKNKGMNIWVYEPGGKIFTGVELDEEPPAGCALEEKNVTLAQYGYYKHIGPYNLIKKAGTAMKNELVARGFETGLPYIEIYGHWNNDESRLETELLMAVARR
jgi:hypothetical protein